MYECTYAQNASVHVGATFVGRWSTHLSMFSFGYLSIVEIANVTQENLLEFWQHEVIDYI